MSFFEWLKKKIPWIGGRSPPEKERSPPANPEQAGARSPPDRWDLERPLFYLTKHDPFTIGMACEHIQIFGSSGSGKTSGSGKVIAHSYLRAGFGGLWLCLKAGERQLVERYAAECGRSHHLVIISPDHPHTFNFLNYELRRQGGGGGQTENLVGLLTNVIAIAEGKAQEISGDDTYWQRAARELLRNSIDLLKLGQGTITLEDIYKVISEAPQNKEEIHSESWWETSFTAKCLKAADAKPKTEVETHDFQMVERFWTHSYPTLDSRPRSGVVSTLTSTIDQLLHGVAWRLLATSTNVVMESTYRDGAIIVVDMPTVQWGEVGRLVQGVIKLMFQRTILQRNVEKWPRPCFLFTDEAATFLSPFDHEYLSAARSMRGCVVFLSQNISGYLVRLKRDEVHSLLENFNLKIFHANSGETNEYASSLISESQRIKYGFSISGTGTGTGHSSSGSEVIMRKVLPSEFTTLRRGGAANQNQVEAIVVQTGRLFKGSGDTWIRTTFKQG